MNKSEILETFFQIDVSKCLERARSSDSSTISGERRCEAGRMISGYTQKLCRTTRYDDPRESEEDAYRHGEQSRLLPDQDGGQQDDPERPDSGKV